MRSDFSNRPSRIASPLIVASLLVLSTSTSCSHRASDADDCDMLELLGTSALNYRDSRDVFPPSVVLDGNGKRMHSWRVLLVPFIEANAFTEQYDFDSAWNEPSNADLADGSRRTDGPKFPDPASVRSVYQADSRAASPEGFATDFLMVTGHGDPVRLDRGHPGSPPPGGWWAPAAPNPDELIIVQVRSSDVHWMEPRDLVLTSPAPEWGIPIDEIEDEIVASAVVSDGQVTCKDRAATLKLLAERKRGSHELAERSRLKRAAPTTEARRSFWRASSLRGSVPAA